MRVLHLVAPPDMARAHDAPWRSDAAVRTCVKVMERASIAGGGSHRHAVILIGGSAAERRAAVLGLPTTDRVAPPGGVAALGWRGVHRLARARGAFDVVQAWSGDLVRLGRMIGVAPVCPPPRILVCTPTPHDRAATRAALGVRDDRPLVLMLSDPPASIDVRQCWFLASLFEVAAWPGQVIVPAPSTARSRRLSGPMKLVHATRTDLPGAALVGACDLAAIMPPPQGPVGPDDPAILAGAEMALRAGLPLVVPPGSALAGRCRAIDPSLVALWNTGAAVATALGPLLADRARRSALSRACSAAALPPNIDHVIAAWRTCVANSPRVRSLA
ncbi:MAG: hypothetical protein JNL50_06740 [Phycisphaerae bacterium]|nr:hypothetical protein [Phycisphaerae bacterium]